MDLPHISNIKEQIQGKQWDPDQDTTLCHLASHSSIMPQKYACILEERHYVKVSKGRFLGAASPFIGGSSLGSENLWSPLAPPLYGLAPHSLKSAATDIQRFQISAQASIHKWKSTFTHTFECQNICMQKYLFYNTSLPVWIKLTGWRTAEHLESNVSWFALLPFQWHEIMVFQRVISGNHMSSTKSRFLIKSILWPDLWYG